MELNVYIEPDFPETVMMDEIRIKQVVFNLVGNAIKFTHRGFINVKARFIPLSETKGQLVLEVEDSGIGIHESQQEVIFEAFRQQYGQSNRDYGGVGLGLAITRRLVERMNGTISVSSEVGMGSVFRVVFSEVETGYGSMRKDLYEELQNVIFEESILLVVDDVPANIESMENLLSASAITVLSAENGESALEMLNYSRPDLILLDLRMPGIDGYEVAQRIKANKETNKIPVIAYTASVFSSDKIDESGDFDGFMYKPVSRSELFHQLKKFLKFTIEKANLEFDGKSVSSGLSINQEVKDNLGEIVIILKELFLPKWEAIKDSLVLFKIEAFSKELKEFACNYQFGYLEDYAMRIHEDVESVDLESLRATLHEFLLIYNQLVQQNNQP